MASEVNEWLWLYMHIEYCCPAAEMAANMAANLVTV